MQSLPSITVTILIALCSISYSARSQNTPSSTPAVFVASTPCGQVAKPLLAIPAGLECERIQWKLSLYPPAGTKAQGRFSLHCTYGITGKGFSGFEDGGHQGEVTGRWSIMKGSKKDTAAIIYQLTIDKPGVTLSFLKMGDRLLHLLDKSGRLMIGGATWSYTLYKLQ